MGSMTGNNPLVGYEQCLWMTPFCVTTANQCADMWKMAMALLYAMSIIIISLYYFMHATRVCVRMSVCVCLPYTFCDCVCSFLINLMINRFRKIYWVFAWHWQAAACGMRHVATQAACGSCNNQSLNWGNKFSKLLSKYYVSQLWSAFQSKNPFGLE